MEKQFVEPKKLTIPTEMFRYGITVAVLTFFIFVFSIFMIAVVNVRGAIDMGREKEISNVYGGELMQNSPVLNRIMPESSLLKDSYYSPMDLDEFVKNATITDTKADMTIDADFVKKGLQYEPTFKTRFTSTYTLKNNLTKESAVSFEFPFPFEVESSELSNVTLTVNGEVVKKPKAKIIVNGQKVDGLKWEGKLKAEESREITVMYETIGVGGLVYEGFNNPTGAQNFALNLTITGTRDYNLVSGLSVDTREFGDKTVTLRWDKTNLFSTPRVHVNIGRKLSPSIQVSKVYAIMAPLFVLFSTMLIWFGKKNQKSLAVKDLLIASIIFTVYFPLWHYITSFTVDPTMEFFASWKTVSYFSMSLYAGFGIAFAITTLLLSWTFGVLYGIKHLVSAVVPTIVISLGFFPLAMTVPDYSILMSLFGLIALIALFIRFRLNE